MPRLKKESVTIAFVCSIENAENIEAAAESYGVSRSAVINIILKRYFEKEELDEED